MTTQEIRQIMAKVCKACGVPDLDRKVRIEWNDRFTQRLGDANYSKMRIRLSVPLWERANAQEREQVVAHEMCHIVASHKYGDHIKAHGGEWRACMMVAGYPPDRCHSVDRTGLRKTRKTCETRCGCGLHMVTPKVFGRVVKGSMYTCRRCNQKLYIEGLGRL
jgi:SprT protein